MTARRSLLLTVFVPVALIAVLVTGCKSPRTGNAGTSTASGDSSQRSIHLYNQGVSIPRPFRVVGKYSSSKWESVDFGTKLWRKAQKRGADAVKITEDSVSWGRWWWYPFFVLGPPTERTHFFKADLVCFTDVWEKLEISEGDFLAYLKTNRETLDPIEGVWTDADGQGAYKLAIKRDSSKAGREFIGFIVSGERPGFPQGYKKMDITRSVQVRGVYNIVFYRDDFTPIGTEILPDALTFSLHESPYTRFIPEKRKD